MSEIAAGRARAGRLGDGEPADRQGPRRRHGPVLGEVPRGQPVPAARLHGAARRAGAPHLAAADERRSTRSRSASTAAAASRSATRWSRARSSSAPRRSRRRCASSATRATARRTSGSRSVNGQHGIWECTRCYFCNERCPKGVDPRDAIAKLGAESIKEGIDRDMGAKHAKWFVTSAKTTGWLRETELVPKTQGIVESIRQVRFALGLLKVGKVPPPFPPHVAQGRPRVAAAARPARTSRRRAATPGSSRASGRSRRLAHGQSRASATRYGPGSFPRPYLEGEEAATDEQRRDDREAGRLLQGLPGVALGEGARLLDPGARAEGRARADRARVGHLLRRRRHPGGRARLLPAPERAHPLLRGRDRRRTR